MPKYKLTLYDPCFQTNEPCTLLKGDYCDVYLTHDSMSVRKAHNTGRNHERNVLDYYQQIGHEKAQSVIDSITNSYAAEGQASMNPMLGGGFGGPGPHMNHPSHMPGGPGGFGGPPPHHLPPGAFPPPPFGFPPLPGGIPPPHLLHQQGGPAGPGAPAGFMPPFPLPGGPGSGARPPFPMPPFPQQSPGGNGTGPPPPHLQQGAPFPPPPGAPGGIPFPMPGVANGLPPFGAGTGPAGSNAASPPGPGQFPPPGR